MATTTTASKRADGKWVNTTTYSKSTKLKPKARHATKKLADAAAQSKLSGSKKKRVFKKK